MANLNESTPVVRITHLNGLTVCQTNDGTVVVPIQWDYAAWTPMTEKFITALKAWKFYHPGFGLCRYSDRRRLTHDRSGSRCARREGHDQGAPRPTAMKTKPPRGCRARSAGGNEDRG